MVFLSTGNTTNNTSGMPGQGPPEQQSMPGQSATPTMQPQMPRQSVSGPGGVGGPGPTVNSNPELDAKRIAVVLEINSELIRGAMAVNKEDAGQNDQEPQYFSCMKRLQCNLAYLAALADKSKMLPQTQFPQILTPPPEIPTLQEPYRRLQALFPEVMVYIQQQLQLRRQRSETGSPYSG